MEEFVTFPPNGLLPLPGGTTRTARGCDLWDEIFEATLLVNPAFDIYRIFDTVSTIYIRSIRLLMRSPSTPSFGTFSVSRGHLYLDSGRSMLTWHQGLLPSSSSLTPVLRPGGRQEGYPRADKRYLDGV